MSWNQKYFIIIFKLKLLSCFEAERFMPLDRAHLWGHGAPVKRRSDALFVIWTIVEDYPHQKRMFSSALIAMNVDFICWHVDFPSGRISTFRSLNAYQAAEKVT
jgi:hypothetical protein